MVKLNSEVVKLNSEKKVQITDSFFFFFFNPKEFIKIPCLVAKCWKIALHLKMIRLNKSYAK